MQVFIIKFSSIKTLQTFYIIYHHVSIGEFKILFYSILFFAVISLIVNATLITLILKYSRKEMGAYRYLLLTFASFDIYYGVVHFLVMPVRILNENKSPKLIFQIPEAWGNAFLMGAHGYVTGKYYFLNFYLIKETNQILFLGKLAVSWFAAVHSHSFTVLVFHFLYRLLAVRGWEADIIHN